MKIAIGCDHTVTRMKNEIIGFLKSKQLEVIDCGTYDDTRTHYPIYGFEVGRLVVTKQVDLGVVICGTGVGISNAVNKVKGVRAALTREVSVAVVAKQLYNANVIAIGGRVTGVGLAEEIILAFINAKYLGANKAIINAIDQQIANNNYNIHLFDNAINK
jgi:galactose-6-phosphate isomerase